MQILVRLVLCLGLLLPVTTQASVKSTAQAIENKTNAMLGSSKSAVQKTSLLLATLPYSPDFVTLANKVPIDELQQLIQAYIEAMPIEDVQAILEANRAGYDTWLASGGASMMRSDLLQVIDDVVSISASIRKMRCLESPDISTVRRDYVLVRQALGKVPPMYLYALELTLNGIQPDWRLQAGSLKTLLPTDLADGLCADAVDFASSRPVLLLNNPQGENFEMARCVALMSASGSTVTNLRKAYTTADRMHDAYSFLRAITSKKVQAGLFGNFAAGAGAQVSAKNPLKPLWTILAVELEMALYAIDFALSEREHCAAADRRMETDLLACNMRFDYLHELGRYRIQNYYQRAVTPDSNEAYQIDDFQELCEGYKRKVCEQFNEGNQGGSC